MQDFSEPEGKINIDVFDVPLTTQKNTCFFVNRKCFVSFQMAINGGFYIKTENVPDIFLKIIL